MKFLKITYETNPKNPMDGNAYVFYNPILNKVWIFMGFRWILQTGIWNSPLQWINEGEWKMF